MTQEERKKLQAIAECLLMIEQKARAVISWCEIVRTHLESFQNVQLPVEPPLPKGRETTV